MEFDCLVCSHCGGVLKKAKNQLICQDCQKEFFIKKGIVIMWDKKFEKDIKIRQQIEKELRISREISRGKTWLGQEYWSRHKQASYAAEMIDKKAFNSLKSLFPYFEGLRVLNIGSGGGKDAEWLLEQGIKEVVCTDISLNLTQLALKRFAGKKKKPSWYFLANAENLPLKKDSFDMAFFGSALHHIARPYLALASAAGVAPIIVLVDEPAKMRIFDYFLKKIDWCTEYGGLKTHRFSPDELKSWMGKLGHYKVFVKTDFTWFPLRLLRSLANSRLLVGIYFRWLSWMDKLSGRWGHNLSMVAIRQDVYQKYFIKNKEIEEWDSFFQRLYWFFARGAPSKNRCLEILKKLNLSKKARIIEMGCGTGFFLRWFKKEGFVNLWGLDFSQKLLDRLSGEGIKCVNADARKTGLKKDYFDLVFSEGLIEHFREPASLLKEFFRLTKDYLVTIVPRETLQNRIEVFLMRPPKEFKLSEKAWVNIHRRFGFKDLRSYILGNNCLMIICRKNKKIPSLKEK